MELSFVLELVTELTSKVVQLPTTAAHPVNYQPMKGPPSASLSHRPLVHMDAESAVAHSRCIRPGGFFTANLWPEYSNIFNFSEGVSNRFWQVNHTVQEIKHKKVATLLAAMDLSVGDIAR